MNTGAAVRWGTLLERIKDLLDTPVDPEAYSKPLLDARSLLSEVYAVATMGGNSSSAERVMSAVEMSGDHWVWRGARYPDGRPKVYWRGASVGAYRAVWEIDNARPLRKKESLRRLCDEPLCVNPKHYRISTSSGFSEDDEDGSRARRCRAGHVVLVAKHQRCPLCARERRAKRNVVTLGRAAPLDESRRSAL